MAEGKAGFHMKTRTWRKPGVNKGKSAQPGGPDQPPIRCPECGSNRIWKDGMRYTNRGEVQRYLCRSCGFRFSESTAQLKVKVNVLRQLRGTSGAVDKLAPSTLGTGDLSTKETFNKPPFPEGENVCSHTAHPNTPLIGKGLYSFYSNNRNCRVRASDAGAKNLAEVESRNEKRAAGATTQAEIKGKLVEYAWWMKKQGYADHTIRCNASALKVLIDRGADINSPESVKDVIARQKWSGNRRKNVINAYTLFLKMHGGHWEKPKCAVEQKIPFIPTERELDYLIAESGRKLSTFLQLLKETAMRAGEAVRLEWTDLDFERRIITLNKPEKRSDPRTWKVSVGLMAMLKNLPRDGSRVFGRTTYHALKQLLQKTRKRLAYKLQNPRLERITFHTFRHWKATMLYHQTKDPYYVKQFLGHKTLKNTEIYINIEKTIFGEYDDEFTAKVASKPEEIKSLLEAGFDYVCQKDGLMFFRKRK